MSIILVFGRLEQEDCHKSQSTLGYRVRYYFLKRIVWNQNHPPVQYPAPIHPLLSWDGFYPSHYQRSANLFPRVSGQNLPRPHLPLATGLLQLQRFHNVFICHSPTPLPMEQSDLLLTNTHSPQGFCRIPLRWALSHTRTALHSPQRLWKSGEENHSDIL